MTVSELREILADAPDDAPVWCILNPDEGTPLYLIAGEVLDGPTWGLPTDAVQLQISHRQRRLDGTP